MANELSNCKYTRLLVNGIIFLPFFEKIMLNKLLYEAKMAQKVQKTKKIRQECDFFSKKVCRFQKNTLPLHRNSEMNAMLQ